MYKTPLIDKSDYSRNDSTEKCEFVQKHEIIHDFLKGSFSRGFLNYDVFSRVGTISWVK